jgi:hypothetical protein
VPTSTAGAAAAAAAAANLGPVDSEVCRCMSLCTLYNFLP